MARYDLDLVHSNLGFSVRHLLITRVHGAFTRWSGTFDYLPEAPERSSVSIEIDVASIDTRNPQRDAHLRSPDFFDAANHPQITFRTTAVRRSEQGLVAIGPLTVRGTTKETQFTLTPAGAGKDSQGRARLGFRATTTLSRSAFGVSWSQVYEGGSVVVADDVEVVLDLQLIPA